MGICVVILCPPPKGHWGHSTTGLPRLFWKMTVKKSVMLRRLVSWHGIRFVSTHQGEPRRNRRRCGSCTYRGDNTAVATFRRRRHRNQSTPVASMRRTPLPVATQRSRGRSERKRRRTSVASSIRRKSPTCTCTRSIRIPPRYNSTAFLSLHNDTTATTYFKIK